MRALDAEAKDRGVLLLNETGLDPGIDHMTAMEHIDEVKENGGEVRVTCAFVFKYTCLMEVRSLDYFFRLMVRWFACSGMLRQSYWLQIFLES